jgi:CheY-like chemotaxis protein
MDATAAETSKTLLVVDDEEDICESLRDIFELEGYRVAVAHDGAEALALLKRIPKPCLVVLDILMPVLDGTAVYAAMKGDPGLADVPIVISTSDTSRAPPGAWTLRKPVNVDALLDAVRKCC